MTKPKTIWLILLVATICVYFQLAPRPASPAKIKVENDGGVISGFNKSAATAYAYDPYFISVNDTPHIQISDVILARQSDSQRTFRP